MKGGPAGPPLQGLGLTTHQGVGIGGQRHGHTSVGNCAGVDPTGSTRMPNGTFPNSGDGIRVENASNNFIGTTAPVGSVTKVNGSGQTFPYSTNVNVTSIGGACGTLAGDSSTVNPLINGAATAPATATCTAGAWSLTLTTALSTQGSRTFSATQGDTAGDTAGNTGTAPNQAITIDTTAPAASTTNLNASAPTSPYYTTVT